MVFYRKAVIAKPDYAEAYNNIARTNLQLSDFKAVAENFNIAYRLNYGTALNEKVISRNKSKITDNFISIHKLKHDIEQFNYLKNQNLFPEIFSDLITKYQNVFKEIELQKSDSFLIKLNSNQLEKISKSYLKNIYREPEINIDFSVINPDLDIAKIQNEYNKNNPSCIYFDNFLTDKALDYLNNFCLNSTIWHNYKKSGGYLGSSIDEGFSCNILYRIADELRKSFPEIFQDLPLIYMWAYKYDSHLSGIAAHADKAFINVNFWITPDTANLDSETGGMIIYDKVAPPDWDFKMFNAKSDSINDFLEKSEAKKQVIPYKQNRVVIFNSDLFHETDKFNFKEGYPNRRINITMLFGNR